MLLAAAGASGAEPETAASSPCPGATAWLAAHPGASSEAIAQRDAARLLADPELREQLRTRVAMDQRARKAWLANPRDFKRSGEVRRLDAANSAWLRGLAERRQFPDAAAVGEGGLVDLWLLVQHADADIALQEIWLTVLQQRQLDGEFAAGEVARLSDRILKGRGQPQRYGTQFSPEEWLASKFIPPDGRPFADFDIHRSALGLMPLADYACQMTWERTGRH